MFPSERAADQAVGPAAPRILVLALARGHCWLDLLENGRFAGVAELAEAVGCDPSFVRRLLNLTLLSPAMVQRVLDGTEGDADTLARFARCPCPVWEDDAHPIAE